MEQNIGRSNVAYRAESTGSVEFFIQYPAWTHPTISGTERRYKMRTICKCLNESSIYAPVAERAV